MQRPCDVCGEIYEAKRSTSKTCSARCRVAKSRGAIAVHQEPVTDAVTPPPVVSVVPAGDSGPGPVESATLTQLQTADRTDTPLGQAALALARRIDYGRDPGAGLAALAKQLEATLSSATADVQAELTPLDRARDDLAARRARSA